MYKSTNIMQIQILKVIVHSRAGTGNGKRPVGTFLGFYAIFFTKIVKKVAFFENRMLSSNVYFQFYSKTTSKYSIKLAPSNCKIS